MDYEKKYKVALERANIIYTGKYKPEIAAWTKKSLEAIFPELKESEGERIRRQTLKVLNYYKDEEKSEGRMPTEIDECIAWLEKQGEKPQRIISAEAKEAMYSKHALSEDDEIVEEIIDFLDEYIGSVKPPFLSHPVKSKWCNWLKSLKQRIGGEQ